MMEAAAQYAASSPRVEVTMAGNTQWIPIMAGIVTVVTGCAHLSVYPLPAATDNPPLDGDIVYYLPRTSITLSGTTTISKCDVTWDAKARSYTADVKTTATATPLQTTEPDPDAHYYISYKLARSWMKEINYSVTNTPGGMLQTFNGTINDQVGSDIVAAIGTVVQIGGAIGTGGAGRPATPRVAPGVAKPPAPVYCTEEVIDGLKEVQKQLDIIKKAKETPPKNAAEIAVQAEEIQNAQSAIDGAMKTYRLVRSFSFKWVPQRGQKVGEDALYDYFAQDVALTSVINAWFSPAGLAWLGTPAAAQLTTPFLAALAVDRRSMGEVPVVTQGAPQKLDGLVIRDPARAVLRLCKKMDPGCVPQGAAIPDNSIVDNTYDIGARLAVSLPQFGRIMRLPEHSALFENANLTVALNADGSVSTIGYHSVSTAATAVTGVGTAAGGVTSGLAARNTAIGAVSTAAAAETTANINKVQGPDTYNKALADCLTQQKTIRQAGGTPVSCQ
jgi:hypothetical protein